MTEEKKPEFYGMVTGRFASRAPAERMTVPGATYLAQSLTAQRMMDRAARDFAMSGDMVDLSTMAEVDYSELERRALAFWDAHGYLTAAEFNRLLEAPDPTERPRPDDETYVREGRNEANRTQRRAERRYLDMKRPKGNRR